jgi:hypothetical protein
MKRAASRFGSACGNSRIIDGSAAASSGVERDDSRQNREDAADDAPHASHSRHVAGAYKSQRRLS